MASDLRFACYDHRFVQEDYSKITRYLIVLKKGREVVAWTDLHKYIKNRTKVRSLYSKNRKPYTYVSMFLNYLFFEKYHIKSIKEIKIDMVKDFLNDFGLHKLTNDTENTHRGQNTVNEVVGYIMSFLQELGKSKNVNFKESDLFFKEQYFNKDKRKMMARSIPAFDVFFIPHEVAI